MKKRIFMLLSVAVLSLLLLVSCAEVESQPNRATVTLDAKKGELTVTVMPNPETLERYQNTTLYLFALAPGKTEADLATETPVASAEPEASLSFKLPLFENGSSYLYHSFMAAYMDESGKYVAAVEGPAYIQNPEVLSENDSEYQQSGSLKGINAEYDLDAVELGVDNAVIEIAVENYLLGTPNSEAYSHIYGGESFYFDRDTVETLDRRVKFYTDRGVNVYFRFVLKTEPEELAPELACLAYTGAADEEYFAINMTDSRAAAYVTGLIDFMAERYTRPDGLYGLCANFIAGKALNSPGDSLGDSGREKNQLASSMLVRIMHIAMVSHFENGRVFVTVDNNWSSTTAGGAGDSSSYNFLTDFAKRAAFGGDYPWGIAAAVRANSAEPDRIWYDDSGNGKYLTPTNINTVTGNDFLGLENMRYDGSARNMIVSDFSVALGESEIAPELQAASYAYAYYKFVAAGNIDAVIYSYQTDTASRRVGLRPVDDEGKPGATRRLWSLLRDIDTDADINSFVSQYIKEENYWKTLYKENSAKVRVKQSRTGGAALGVLAEDYSPSTLFGFNDGTLQGFSATGEGSYAGLVKVGSGSALSAYLPSESVGVAYIACSGITAAQLSQNSLLTTVCINAAPGASAASGYRVALTLVQHNAGKKDVVYTSVAEGIAAGAPITLAFDIGTFREVMQKGGIELRLSAVGADGSGCVLRVDSIMSGKVQKNTWLIVLLILLAVLALVGMVVLAVIWYRKRCEAGDPPKLPFVGGSKKTDKVKVQKAPKPQKEPKKKKEPKPKKEKKVKKKQNDVNAAK